MTSTGRARLFVAVWPPADVVERLAQLPRSDEPDVRWTPAENWHVTLRFLGQAAIEDVCGRLDDVRLPLATLRLGPQVGRLGRDGVVVAVAGVDAVAAAVTEATRDLGQPPGGRPFTGHLTLARLRRPDARCRLLGRRFEDEFVSDEVVLARSTLSPAGARYEIVARWPTPATLTAQPP